MVIKIIRMPGRVQAGVKSGPISLRGVHLSTGRLAIIMMSIEIVMVLMQLSSRQVGMLA
jgi:hypothetical protein